MTNANQSRSIGIDAWCVLAKEECAPPVTIPLEGSSMMPLIRRSMDPVTIVPLQRPLKKGDVVLFTAGKGRYVVHRVWKLEESRLLTIGDNCVNPDGWIPYEAVLGQAVAFTRNGCRYRLDTRAARIWGRVWMWLYPVRRSYIRLRRFVVRRYRPLFD